MSATLEECSVVPFHVELTKPIDEAAVVRYPAMPGAYDPVEQIWKLPEGTPLTSPKVIEDVGYETPTWTILHDSANIDDYEYEA
jgi:hypothetical protein